MAELAGVRGRGSDSLHLRPFSRNGPQDAITAPRARSRSQAFAEGAAVPFIFKTESDTQLKKKEQSILRFAQLHPSAPTTCSKRLAALTCKNDGREREQDRREEEASSKKSCNVLITISTERDTQLKKKQQGILSFCSAPSPVHLSLAPKDWLHQLARMGW